MLNMKSGPKNRKPIRNWEGLEAIKELPRDIAQVAREEIQNMGRDTVRQVIGIEKGMQRLSGELKAGESIDFTQIMSWPVREPELPQPDSFIEPGIDYSRKFRSVKERYTISEDTRQVGIRIEQILVELKNLIATTAELSVGFKEVTMEEVPSTPGTYHLNFFEWVLSVIRKARERIEESQTWLSMFTSKKNQKHYWNMFKKHGTTFGLSGERIVSTQTG